MKNALLVNHHLEFITVSAKTGEGMNVWYEWLIKQSALFLSH
jgi:hydrogenase nickel incorporation protein HypB